MFKIQKQNLFDIDNIFETLRDKFKTFEKEKKRIKNQFIDKRIEYDDLIKLNEICRFERVFNFDSNKNSNNIDNDEKKLVDNDSIVTNFVNFSKKKRTNKHSDFDKFTNDVNFD